MAALRPVLLLAVLLLAAGRAEACDTASMRHVMVDPLTTPAVGTIDSRAAKAGPENTFQPLPLKRGEVVLTFDDGPDPRTTPQVLDALKARCMTATFFLLGRNAKRQPALVRRIVAEGHGLGSHTWSHANLTKLAPAAARREIASGIASIEGALRGAPGAPNRIALFRFPNLAYTPGLLDWLQAQGIVAVSADIATRDWANPPGQETFDAVMKQLDRRGKGIILLHDVKPHTAEVLPRLLDALTAGGYRVVRLMPRGG